MINQKLFHIFLKATLTKLFHIFLKATLTWRQHWLQHKEPTLLSRTQMATPRFILLQKMVSFDHHMKEIFLKGMLKWWGFWWQHQELTLLSRTKLEKQQNSWQGILQTDYKLSRQILEEYVQGWQSQICVSCDPWHHGAASNWGVGIEGVHEEHADGWGGSQDQRAGVSGDLKFFLLISGSRCVLMRWCPRSKSSSASTATLCVEHAGLAFR